MPSQILWRHGYEPVAECVYISDNLNMSFFFEEIPNEQSDQFSLHSLISLHKQDYESLFRTIQDNTGLYLTIQGYMGLYRTIEAHTGL